jgi:flagellar biosynthesis component FlhA
MTITVVLFSVASILITWALTRHHCQKSSKDLTKLIKELAPHEEITSEKTAAKLLLELIDALEKNKIYWREFTVFVKTMIKAGNIANETIEHISLIESQRLTMSTRISPREDQSVRKMEILKLRQTLEKQLKQ